MTQQPTAGVSVEHIQDMKQCWRAVSVQAGLKPVCVGSDNGDLFCAWMCNCCGTRSGNQDEKCE